VSAHVTLECAWCEEGVEPEAHTLLCEACAKASLDDHNALVRVLTKLVSHMRRWGAEEDGIPEEMADDWEAARDILEHMGVTL
jgi:hypothetical protein